MNQGYQNDDVRILDYGLWQPPGLGLTIRGPAFDVEPGGYGVTLGAAQTFGRFAKNPYPELVSRAIDFPILNLGISGAGPSFFSRRPEMLKVVNRARFAVVQVMSGRSVSNSVFAVQRNQGLVVDRRVENGRPKFAQDAYQELLRTNEVEELVRLKAEIRWRYAQEFIELLQLIEVPKVLLYFSARPPQYKEGLGNLNAYWGNFPHFVNQEVIDLLCKHADHYVEAVSGAGLPQLLTDQETGEPIEMWPPEKFPDVKLRHHNHYYPSPEMHDVAAKRLIPVCDRLTPTRHRTTGAARDVLVHMHLYKNAGTSVDRGLRACFGESFATIDPVDPRDVYGQDDVIRHLKENPRLRALSSHQLRQPMTGRDGITLHPFFFLRHPIDRLHSIYSFERTPARQAQSKGPLTRWAMETDFAEFLQRCMKNPATVALVSNFQTRALRPLIGKAAIERWGNVVSLSDLMEVIALVDQLPAVGVVDMFEASLTALQAAYGERFPELKLSARRDNVSREVMTLEESLGSIAAELGKELHERLLELNALDLELYRVAREKILKGGTS